MYLNVTAATETSTPGPAAPQPLFRIQPSRGWVALNLRELWH
jgi:hypothetical protein